MYAFRFPLLPQPCPDFEGCLAILNLLRFDPGPGFHALGARIRLRGRRRRSRTEEDRGAVRARDLIASGWRHRRAAPRAAKDALQF